MKKLFLLLAITLLPTGCAFTGFKDFYHGANKERVVESQNIETCATPELQRFSSSVPREEVFAYLGKNGYQIIGYSHFSGSADHNDEKGALRYGQELGACLVLFAQDYEGTATAQIPITTPTYTTTNVSGTVTGSGGVSTFSGTAGSWESTTSYIPISAERYTYLAIYAVKLKPGVKADQSCKTTLGVTECFFELP